MHLGATGSKSVSSMSVSLFIPLKEAQIVVTEGGGGDGGTRSVVPGLGI